MKSFITAVAAISVLMVGCKENHRGHNHSHQQKKVDAHLLSYQDFDLEAVVSVVKGNKVQGAQALQDFINGDNGVNNVDIDKDSKIDFITVVEGREGENILLDFVATPSSGEGEKVTVANLKFSQTAGSDQMHVQGGYPTYVNGHSQHYYSYHQPRHGITAGQALFMMWLLSPGRSMYMAPAYSYSPRPVMSQSAVSSKRTVTRTTQKVSPVKKTTRPSSYSVKSAQKTQSKLKSSGSSAFRTRAYNKERKKATGFGAKNKKATTKPTQQKSRSWGSRPSRRSSPSRPSRSRSGGGRRRSSIQYKTDVAPIRSGMEIVEALQPVNWKWKEGTVEVQTPTIGFIAEDVAKMMPELVYTKNGKIEGINYDLIVVPLVNAVKEQQAEIKRLSSDVEKLRQNSGTQQGCRE